MLMVTGTPSGKKKDAKSTSPQTAFRRLLCFEARLASVQFQGS